MEFSHFALNDPSARGQKTKEYFKSLPEHEKWTGNKKKQY